MKLVYVGTLLGLVCFCAAGCGSDNGGGSSGDDDTTGSTGATSGGLEVFPPKIYTGFDGTHNYKAPVIAHGASGAVTWKVADEAIAQAMPSGSNVTLIGKKAGETTLTATVGGKTASASVKVYSYTMQQYEAGAARYMTDADADNPACIKCHEKGKGPNHTPTEVDADTDDELQHTFTTGVDPENRPIAENSEFAHLLNGKKHMWKVTDTEKTGLLSYLRTLEPDGFPEYDAPTTMK